MSTGIVSTAILLIIGYVIISRLIGLAFRIVVPVVLIAVLAGAGLFSGLMPNRPPVDPYRPYDHGDGFPDDARRVGDIRLGDLPEIALDAVRSALRGTLALLDGADPDPAEQRPPYSDQRHWQNDRFREPPPMSR